jgi:hypothetical protein
MKHLSFWSAKVKLVKNQRIPQETLDALKALRRSAKLAKNISFLTGTFFVHMKDGKIVKEKVTQMP